MITTIDLKKSGKILVDLARQYRGSPHREMGLDGLVFGFLFARFGSVERQYKIHSQQWKRPKRIDFRQKGQNPVVIEFAARTPGRNEHYGSQNRDELRKLTKQVQASMRFLLLLDVSGEKATTRNQLKSTYDSEHTGTGRFSRTSVRVVYAHPDVQYDFLWKP